MYVASDFFGSTFQTWLGGPPSSDDFHVPSSCLTNFVLWGASAVQTDCWRMSPALTGRSKAAATIAVTTMTMRIQRDTCVPLLTSQAINRFGKGTAVCGRPPNDTLPSYANGQKTTGWPVLRLRPALRRRLGVYGSVVRGSMEPGRASPSPSPVSTESTLRLDIPRSFFQQANFFWHY